MDGPLSKTGTALVIPHSRRERHLPLDGRSGLFGVDTRRPPGGTPSGTDGCQ